MDDASRDPDRLTRFLLEHAGVRGVRVHLDAAWRDITSRADYPREVALLLGQAAVATALLTAHAKVEGRLSLQLRGEAGPLRLLFADNNTTTNSRKFDVSAEGQQVLNDFDIVANGGGSSAT